MSYPLSLTSPALNRASIPLIICLLTGFLISVGFAQEKQSLEEMSRRPIFVTMHVFQLQAQKASSQELNDQVFKMRTASLGEYDKWINALKKTYPGFDVSLLRTDSRRVFRTSKQASISLGKQTDERDIRVVLSGAQSPGDGETPGTSLIPEIGVHFGRDLSRPSVTYAMHPLEVESGMTYFFAAKNLKLSSTDYVKFVRPNVPAEAFADKDIFLAFAFSVDLDKTAEPLRYLDERQSMQLQNEATRKVQPEVPANLRDAGLGGFIRVSVEINLEGKVTSANIHYSSFPEMNNEALVAARQWEFPTTLFFENKKPITGFLTFSFAAKSATPAPGQKGATKNPSMQ
jgi:TonB family protein